MKNKSEKQVKNSDNSTEKLLLSDVSVAKHPFCLFDDWCAYREKTRCTYKKDCECKVKKAK